MTYEDEVIERARNDVITRMNRLREEQKGHDDDDDDDDRMSVAVSEAGTILAANNLARDAVGLQERDEIVTMKVRVFGVFVLVALLISIPVAVVTSKQGEAVLDPIFERDAAILFRHIGDLGKLSLRDSGLVGTGFISRYQAQDAKPWPFASLPDFDIYASSVREDLKAPSVFMAPEVATQDVAAWIDYSTTTSAAATQAQVAGQTLIDGGSSTVASFANTTGFLFALTLDSSDTSAAAVDATAGKTPTATKTAIDTEASESNRAYYYPLWQASPPSVANVNLDLESLSVFRDAIEDVRTTQKAAISALVPPSVQAALGMSAINTVADVSAASAPQSDAPSFEPTSVLVVPIFDSHSRADRRVVGMTFAPFHWRNYFDDAFSSETPAMQVVLETECKGDEASSSSSSSDIFSFEVADGTARFSGEGDVHHMYFDEFVRSRTYNGLVQEAVNGTSTRSIVGQNELSSDGPCRYIIHVYPTAMYQNEYKDGLPVLLISVIVLALSWSLLLFLYYSGYIEERFHSLRAQANHSSTIINTLFPKGIQDRMFLEHGKDATKQGDKDIMASNGADPLVRIKAFLKTARDDKDDSPPIADLFPDCTVFFADIAGFTNWSDGREPVQVFTLLEIIYKRFDILADRYKVFKVETIGDCYMAVTGLPHAREDHAAIMCRFAADCLRQLSKIRAELVERLGEDTSELSFRIGLNSGPVTAGVLRGQKSRFQLFGDTVNTAARMESTGRRDMVQLSQATVDELITQSKGGWAVPRDGLVEAKGKGRVQTYWLQCNHALSSSAPSINSSGLGESLDNRVVAVKTDANSTD